MIESFVIREFENHTKTEISYSGRQYNPWACLRDEQLTVFAFLLRKKKLWKIEVNKIIIFWNRIIKNKIYGLHVFSVDTRSFSGGSCAHTQSPNPSGRNTGLVVMELKLISRRGISVWSYVTLETSGMKQFFYSDDQVSFEFQNQKWGQGRLSSFRNKEGKENAWCWEFWNSVLINCKVSKCV